MDSLEHKILEFNGVAAGYGKHPILQNVNFFLQKGEFAYLIGRTGAGKSSILKLIYADIKPLAGKVRFEKWDIGTIPPKEVPFLRRKVGIVFQDFQLLPDRDVFENIRFVMKATGWKDKTKIRNKITDLLVRVGLSAKAKSMPHQLSGGEQQRVAIARALVNDPLLLIADEPTGNLDPEATQNIMEILLKINIAGTAILMATHELELIKKYPARTLQCADSTLVDRKMDFVGEE